MMRFNNNNEYDSPQFRAPMMQSSSATTRSPLHHQQQQQQHYGYINNSDGSVKSSTPFNNMEESFPQFQATPPMFTTSPPPRANSTPPTSHMATQRSRQAMGMEPNDYNNLVLGMGGLGLNDKVN